MAHCWVYSTAHSPCCSTILPTIAQIARAAKTRRGEFPSIEAESRTLMADETGLGGNERGLSVSSSSMSQRSLRKNDQKTADFDGIEIALSVERCVKLP